MMLPLNTTVPSIQSYVSSECSYRETQHFRPYKSRLRVVPEADLSDLVVVEGEVGRLDLLAEVVLMDLILLVCNAVEHLHGSRLAAHTFGSRVDNSCVASHV